MKEFLLVILALIALSGVIIHRFFVTHGLMELQAGKWTAIAVGWDMLWIQWPLYLSFGVLFGVVFRLVLRKGQRIAYNYDLERDNKRLENDVKRLRDELNIAHYSVGDAHAEARHDLESEFNAVARRERCVKEKEEQLAHEGERIRKIEQISKQRERSADARTKNAEQKKISALARAKRMQAREEEYKKTIDSLTAALKKCRSQGSS